MFRLLEHSKTQDPTIDKTVTQYNCYMYNRHNISKKFICIIVKILASIAYVFLFASFIKNWLLYKQSSVINIR